MVLGDPGFSMIPLAMILLDRDILADLAMTLLDRDIEAGLAMILLDRDI
jgi:hypothetical protein